VEVVECRIECAAHGRGRFFKSKQTGRGWGGGKYHHWVSEACGAEIVVDEREDSCVYKSNMQNYMATWSIGESNAMMLERGEVFHRGFVAPWTAINYCYGLCAMGGSTDGAQI